MNKKIVLLQGSFDIINSGHVRSFRRAKKLGDYLIVAVNSEALHRSYKKREPLMPYYEKKIILESICWVDKVVKANHFSPLGLLKRYKVDVYMIAPNWLHTKSKEIAYMKSKGGKV